MQKYIQITSNGEFTSTPFKINRLTVSFGKEGTHVLIPSIDYHAFDLIFVNPKESKGFLKSYTTEPIKINQMTVTNIAEIDKGDVITIGQLSMLYYVDHPDVDWRRSSELKRESLTNELKGSLLPPAVEVTMIQFKNPLLSHRPSLESTQQQEVVKNDINESTVKEDSQKSDVSSNSQTTIKRKMLNEVIVHNNYGEGDQRLIENKIKSPPNEEINNEIKEETKLEVQNQPKKKVILLGQHRDSQQKNETSNPRKSQLQETEDSESIAFKLGPLEDSKEEQEIYQHKQDLEESYSPSPFNQELINQEDKELNKEFENESDSSSSKEERDNEEILEEEDKQELSDMSNIVDENDDEQIEDSIKMMSIEDIRATELEEKEQQLKEAKEYSKRFESKVKKEKINESKEERIEDKFEQPTKRRTEVGIKTKRSIVFRKGISGNTFYFGSNEILYIKFEKEIKMYGGISHQGYPDIDCHRITNENSYQENSLLESKIFYVCEKGNEGLLMPYLCCILQRIYVLSSSYLEDVVTREVDFNDYLLPIFPLSSIQKGKLLHGYKIDMNALPKQPIHFESFDPNEQMKIPKFAPKKTNHSYGRRFTASDKIKKEKEIHIENSFIELFIKKIGGLFIESSSGRKNAYDFYVEFVQENNENERKITRSSFNPRTAGNFVDLTWVFEMLKSQHFIHPSEFSSIPPPEHSFISSYDNF
ncbi:hypothetical protein EHI8A_033070 [Entamoeba histolytica HM-1:IMSS-B]|uniref:FHA domain-containing protein n=6 Tax=Entamoeba histolytica TaxID=5759 RepID=C4M2Z2_ENTH1|nr:hypothetical protein EHI_074030 [Entamoeba histolytica HM-1:IMSS]EMD48112.1 Hypothetical protein EHI5A_039420 [Entamoeba histolytica KU27]EMH78271.1 hypothetical protein EHI8A_033070 [Entamoeba histolytica HM-1:IMSS-B]EMS14163.1 hypothetical protein KM1_053110 [Entamoeba histolytica HM-3:IMSS]ENY65460.1 hypothetical protein EHI7A_035940 [Entamoeba histolytica HM-1:IMSS-A]GAT95666.1 hypothetical protein CL6EHI_074030 [Entamoeba histolytica]|eukprot:XP_653564.1 hypothetical protein EHI_074030 [Entamoeba histolytica HM-1:IMSS]